MATKNKITVVYVTSSEFKKEENETFLRECVLPDGRRINDVFEMKGPIKDRMIKFGVSSRFGPDHFFPTIHSAVRSYKKTMGLE